MLPLRGGCSCPCQDEELIIFIWAFSLEAFDCHSVCEMLWLITGWEEVQSNGLTSSAHISLQVLLPPLAQAPPEDFREKTCIGGVSFVGCWFFPCLPEMLFGCLRWWQMGKGRSVPRQFPLGCSPHQPLFPYQRRAQPRVKAPRDAVSLLCSSELLLCVLLGLAA